MDDSVEAVDGDIVLKFKKFLVEGGKMKSVSVVLITSSMYSLTVLVSEWIEQGQSSDFP